MLAEQRRDQFKSDVADLKLKTGSARRDGLLQGAGGVLMVVGVVAGLLLYEASLHQKDQRNIGSEQVLAIAFTAVTVAGSALFVVGSMAKFLRIWLLRQLYDGRAHLDELVAAIEHRP